MSYIYLLKRKIKKKFKLLIEIENKFKLGRAFKFRIDNNYLPFENVYLLFNILN